MCAADKIELYKNGMMQFAQQDFSGAIETLTRALEVDPSYADAYQAMAHCHEKLGDLDSALACAKQAVEHNPDDFLAHTSLSIFYQRKGMIAEAESEKALADQLQHQS